MVQPPERYISTSAILIASFCAGMSDGEAILGQKHTRGFINGVGGGQRRITSYPSSRNWESNSSRGFVAMTATYRRRGRMARARVVFPRPVGPIRVMCSPCRQSNSFARNWSHGMKVGWNTLGAIAIFAFLRLWSRERFLFLFFSNRHRLGQRIGRDEVVVPQYGNGDARDRKSTRL